MRQTGKRGILFFSVSLFLLLLMAMLLFFGRYMDSEPYYLYLTPQWDDLKGWEIYTMEGGEKQTVPTDYEPDHETVYFSRIITEQPDRQWMTNININKTRHQEIIVFLDGQLIFTSSPQAGDQIGRIQFPQEETGGPSFGWWVVSLPPGYSGKTLTIAAAPDHILPFGVYLSNASMESRISSALANQCMIPAAIFSVLGVLLCGLFLYQYAVGRKFYSVLLLAAAAFGQAGNYAAQLIEFGPNVQVVFTITELSRVTLFTFPTAFLLTFLEGRRKKAFLSFLLVPAVPMLLRMILSLADWPVPMVLYLAEDLYLASFLALLVIAVMEYRKKNEIFQMFLRGLAVSCAAIALLALIPGHFCGTNLSVFAYSLHNHELNTALQQINTVLLLVCFGVSMLSVIRYVTQTETQLSVMAVKNELALESLKIVQESSDNLKEMRHNIVHHLAVLDEICGTSDLRRVRDYLKTLTCEINQIQTLVYTDHPIINAILSVQLARAGKEGIEVEVRAEVPEQIPVTDLDLCSLLMNMLQNAREACRPLNESKWIRVFLHVRGSYLYIGVENAKAGPVVYDERTHICRTTKKGDGRHGYGMRTMDEIARRYGSTLVIHDTENTFEISTALRLVQ